MVHLPVIMFGLELNERTILVPHMKYFFLAIGFNHKLGLQQIIGEIFYKKFITIFFPFWFKFPNPKRSNI